MALADVKAPPVQRLVTGIAELDRVLGGGLVPGSLVLLGGSPGHRQVHDHRGRPGQARRRGRSVLYVSGEESAVQVKLRAERLGPDALRVPIVAETELEVVEATLEAERPDVCVIDSVQTLHAAGLTGAAGSVGQVREVAGRLARIAKQRGVAVVLVGHVTKDGALAGPARARAPGRLRAPVRGRARAHLPHAARGQEPLRLDQRGRGVRDGGGRADRGGGRLGARFVDEASRAAGSVVLCAMEGSRPLLVEVQALVAQSALESPRRVANGVDRNRLALVLAVLARHAGLALGSCDVFVSVAGGVRIEEPGADLAVALAVASAARGVQLGSGERPMAAFGEVGLTGELRHAAHPDRRIAEAAKFGLAPVLAPGEHLRTLRAALGQGLGSQPEQAARAA